MLLSYCDFFFILVEVVHWLMSTGWAWLSVPTDVLEYGVMKPPLGSREAALLWGFSDPSRPWGSLGEIYRRGSVAGWPTGTGPNGEVLVIPKAGLWVYLRTQSGYQGKIYDFNRTQSRVVTGLLTGHNTLRRHLYLLGLLDSPLCRKCGVGEETSSHILCEFEALASLRHVYLGSFFLELEDIRSLGLGAIWNYSKVVGLPWFDVGHKGPVLIKV